MQLPISRDRHVDNLGDLQLEKIENSVSRVAPQVLNGSVTYNFSSDKA